MASEIILTADGSHSLHSSQYQAAYHSHYGAIDESITIFISGGLHYQHRNAQKKAIKIFEMGFGTGLNAFLSAIFADKHQVNIQYETIELHPVLKETYQKLNYTELLNHQELFDRLHEIPWESNNQLTDHFSIKKIQGDISNYQFGSCYDLIYFDAFAPSCQAHLWESDLHTKLYKQLETGGCLLTYCAKGDFKRMLKTIGYELEMLPGPAKKKEITRAIKV